MLSDLDRTRQKFISVQKVKKNAARLVDLIISISHIFKNFNQLWELRKNLIMTIQFFFLNFFQPPDKVISAKINIFIGIFVPIS